MSRRPLFAVILAVVLVVEWSHSEPPPAKETGPGGSSGKSIERPVLKEDLQIKAFEYRPVDPAYWAKVEEYIQQGNYIGVIQLGAAHMAESTAGTPEFSEGKLAVAVGLFYLEFTGAATYTLLQIVQEQNGTSVGHAALHYLGRLDSERSMDRAGVERVLIANEFGPLHPHIQSFVSFHKALYNLRYNLKWADEEFKKINPDTYWGFEKVYLSALSEIARGRVEVGRKILEQLYGHAKTPIPLQKKVSLQMARFKFEDNDFISAIQIFRTLDGAPVREKGRLMLERAWAQYYQKEYSKALGILKALEAPYFSSSLTFERHILTMIIYKELCYYEAVEKTAQVFRRTFSSALRDIKKRKRLADNPVLAQMALNHGRLRERADYINLLRRESVLFEQLGFKDLPFYQEILGYYEDRDKELQLRIDRELETKVKDIANELLDVEEQVQFLEYSAQLDSLRILREGETYRFYQTEKINYYGFDRIYWPVDTEFWWDELDHYKVLSSSRCGEAKPNSTENEELE